MRDGIKIFIVYWIVLHGVNLVLIPETQIPVLTFSLALFSTLVHLLLKKLLP
jgi:hypothetical protein